MKKDAWFGVFIWLCIVGGGACIGFIIVSSSNEDAARSCKDRWPGRNAEWSRRTGCMIDTSAGRIPAKNFMVTE